MAGDPESIEAGEIIDFEITWVILKKEATLYIYLGSEEIKLGIAFHYPPYQKRK